MEASSSSSAASEEPVSEDSAVGGSVKVEQSEEGAGTSEADGKDDDGKTQDRIATGK